jgi:ABC-2 type transport system permease protein
MFLSPLLTSGIMVLAFYGIFGVGKSNLLEYSIYVLTGVVLIQFVNSGLQTVSSSIINARGIVSKVKVPGLTFPLVTATSQLTFFLIGLSYSIILTAFRGQFSIRPIFLMLTIIALVSAVYGLGLLLILIGSYFPDMTILLPIILQALTYITPVFYDESIWPTEVAEVLKFNPLLYFVRSFRSSLNTEGTEIYNPMILLLFSAVLACIASLVYSRMYPQILKRQ